MIGGRHGRWLVEQEVPAGHQARERLRDAQRKEAALLTRVAVTEAALERARRKHETTVATARDAVSRAELAVAQAERDLVSVSGINRAAALRGCAVSDLRRRTDRKPAREAAPGSAAGQE